MTRHLLVTNDYPPKVGGIQSYLWELWRRLPSDSFAVYTTPYRGAEQFDLAQNHHIERSREPVLLPNPWLARRINERARGLEVDLIVLDPAVPLGLIGPSLDLPYAVVLHGAEVTVPGRLPVTRQLLNRVLAGAEFAIAAGGYPAEEARRSLKRDLPVVQIPPGVDPERFAPVDEQRRTEVRERYGLSPTNPLVLSVSRLVPRKGMDTLIEAAAQFSNSANIDVAIAGSGRDRRRLQGVIDRTNSPARLLGRVPDEDLPALYASADLFAMLCRSRWGGLEQEGFGIVFLEAAAAGVPQIARRSGGSAEAVLDGVTGRVLDVDVTPAGVAEVIESMLGDQDSLRSMAEQSRSRATDMFGYDHLAKRLDEAFQQW
ncbi:MAG: glycosyltransferase family 4 protein [Acidobacteria bacterium]|nr:glycosyltransferase family 4 protein [Acidobacteriota bacterium]